MPFVPLSHTKKMQASGRLPTPPRPKRDRREYYIELDKQRGDAKQRGYNKQWAALRQRFITTHPTCQCGQQATIVDHIIPITEGGKRLDWNNLQSLCTKCHAMKTHAERKGRITPSN